MNEVKIIFHGIVLWWLTAPGPYALIPDLTTDEMAHDAVIVGKPAAFGLPASKCPRPFDLRDGDCVFHLNGKGLPGGVRISFKGLETRTAVNPDAAGLCAVPRLQGTGPYELLADYTPPSGTRNAAWMSASGGTPIAGTLECSTGRNCPRIMEWTVPGSDSQPVELVLDNLTGKKKTMRVKLAKNARLAVRNSPVEHAGADDWCFYFRMVRRGNDPVQCQGPPTAPQCEGLLVGKDSEHGCSHCFFQTVACSNSTYP